MCVCVCVCVCVSVVVEGFIFTDLSVVSWLLALYNSITTCFVMFDTRSHFIHTDGQTL